jgi:2-methylcitrate dehydratase
VEEKRFSVDYHDPAKRSIGNALLVELNDGTVLDEVEVEYPVGHKRRRAEGTPLLMNKFKRCFSSFFYLTSLTPLQTHFSPLRRVAPEEVR